MTYRPGEDYGTCYRCGARLADDGRFCPECGAAQPASPVSADVVPRRAPSGPRWASIATIVGAILVVAFGALLAIVLLSDGDGDGIAGDPSPSPSAGDSGSRAPASSTASASGAPSASSSAPAGADGVRPDSVVATTVDSLTLRGSAGTSGEQLGFLAADTVAFVISGPETVDGLPWFLVSGMGLPYASGCITTPPDEPISCPAFIGWVAGASPEGDPWLAPTEGPACPEPVTIETISEAGFTLRLVCWAGDGLTFRAYWPDVPDDPESGGTCPESEQPAGFLFCQNINDNGVAANEAEGPTERLTLSIDPESGVTMPERGQFIEVTGHFDDPKAQLCADLAPDGEAPDAVVFRCRLQFVPTSVVPAP